MRNEIKLKWTVVLLVVLFPVVLASEGGEKSSLMEESVFQSVEEPKTTMKNMNDPIQIEKIDEKTLPVVLLYPD